MFARTGFDQFATVESAVGHGRALRTAGRLPPRVLHTLVSSAARAETWLRWPLKTLNMLEGVDDTFRRIDPDGSRYGLTSRVRSRFRRNLLYDSLADLAVLLSNVDKAAFRQRSLAVEGEDILDNERAGGPGAIVVGFRLGVYPVVPLALGAIGYDVGMIVGGKRLIRAGQRLGEEFAPRANSRIHYLNAQDPLVLARSLEHLNAGNVVCTLMELSPIKYAKTTPVQFLGWTINVAYGIPYLSAMTGRPVIPALLLPEKGPRYSLRFLEPLPAPSRDRASILAGTQALYEVLEREVRRHPEHWVGWTILESHLGIDLGRPVPLRMPAVS